MKACTAAKRGVSGWGNAVVVAEMWCWRRLERLEMPWSVEPSELRGVVWWCVLRRDVPLSAL